MTCNSWACSCCITHFMIARAWQRNPLAVNETLAAQFWDVSEKAVAGFLH
jgi:hypothetical protein